MMNKTELTKLITEVKNSILHANSLLSVIMDHLEKNTIEIEEAPQDMLRVGDYISLPADEEHFNWDLYQLVNIGSKEEPEYTFLDVDLLTRWELGVQSTIEDLMSYIPDEACVYRVYSEGVPIRDGKYLVYDPEMYAEFEVDIKYDNNENVFKVYHGNSEDYFIDKVFNNLEELKHHLKAYYKIVRKLRS